MDIRRDNFSIGTSQRWTRKIIQGRKTTCCGNCEIIWFRTANSLNAISLLNPLVFLLLLCWSRMCMHTKYVYLCTYLYYNKHIYMGMFHLVFSPFIQFPVLQPVSMPWAHDSWRSVAWPKNHFVKFQSQVVKTESGWFQFMTHDHESFRHSCLTIDNWRWKWLLSPSPDPSAVHLISSSMAGKYVRESLIMLSGSWLNDQNCPTWESEVTG